MLKPIEILFVMALPLAAQPNQLSPIASTRYEHALPAKSDLGDISISAREMLLDTAYGGKPRKGALLILFDPSSGRYLWEFGPVGQNEKASTHTVDYGTIALAHVASDRLVIFAFARPFLLVHESLGKASGIDDAETRVLAELSGQLPAKFTGRHDDRVLINLGKLVGHEFLMACAMCQGPGPSKILDIIHKGNTWEITLKGQWQEKIILDNKYQVTGALRLN